MFPQVLSECIFRDKSKQACPEVRMQSFVWGHAGQARADLLEPWWRLSASSLHLALTLFRWSRAAGDDERMQLQ